MAEPFAPYAGIEGAALTGGEGGDALHNLLLGIIGGTVSVPERVIKAAQATAPGLRREDVTDIPGPEQPGGELRKETMQAALGLAGTSMPFATSGAAGVFGGRLAATADKAALSKAEQMAASGADRKAIWDETGWFKGGDDKWRFEIPDNKAVLNPNTYGAPWDKMPERGHFGPVAGHLWHKDLYAAYPDARKVTAYVNDGPVGGSYQGAQAGDRALVGSDEAIKFRAPFVEDAKQVALHEMQHAIQAREGFAQGGSPAMFTQGNDAILSRDALSWRREMDRFPGTAHEKDLAAEKAYRDMGAVDWMPSKDAREIAKYKQDNPDEVLKEVAQLYGVDKQTTPYSPKELYRSLPGEIEARNVERRANMTPEELRAKPPWETEHWMDRAATSPALERIFGSVRVGALEGGAASRGSQMSASEKFGASIEAKYSNVKLDIGAPSAGGYATLSRIVVPEAERGGGLGSKVMADLVAEADAKGIPLALSPTSDFGGSKSRLAEFYERFGFVPNKGKNKDFATRETMIRLPRGAGE